MADVAAYERQRHFFRIDVFQTAYFFYRLGIVYVAAEGIQRVCRVYYYAAVAKNVDYSGDFFRVGIIFVQFYKHCPLFAKTVACNVAVPVRDAVCGQIHVHGPDVIFFHYENLTRDFRLVLGELA